MLGAEETYLMNHRMKEKAMAIMKKAKSGRDYGCDLCDAMRMDVALRVRESTVAEEIESLRIFENIFE
jgi:hypothetical protein